MPSPIFCHRFLIYDFLAEKGGKASYTEIVQAFLSGLRNPSTEAVMGLKNTLYARFRSISSSPKGFASYERERRKEGVERASTKPFLRLNKTYYTRVKEINSHRLVSTDSDSFFKYVLVSEYFSSLITSYVRKKKKTMENTFVEPKILIYKVPWNETDVISINEALGDYARMSRKYGGPLVFHKCIRYFPKEIVDYMGWHYLENEEFTAKRIIPISKIIGREVRVQEM